MRVVTLQFSLFSNEINSAFLNVDCECFCWRLL